MKKIVDFIKAMKSAYNQQEALKSELGTPNFKLATELSKQTTLSLEESVEVLKHYDYNLQKCLNMCEKSMSFFMGEYEFFRNCVKRNN